MRPSLRIALSLIFGALTTVAVAWCLTLRATPGGFLSTGLGVPPTSWPVPVPTTWPQRPQFVTHWRGGGIEQSVFVATKKGAAGSPFQVERVHWGWPMRGLATYSGGAPASSVATILNTGYPKPKWMPGPGPGPLPLRPLWLGFAVDTALYAAPWWLLLYAIGAIRGAIRRRRHGRCPTCLYDLRGLPPDAPCPECGHANATSGPLSPASGSGQG